MMNDDIHQYNFTQQVFNFVLLRAHLRVHRPEVVLMDITPDCLRARVIMFDGAIGWVETSTLLPPNVKFPPPKTSHLQGDDSESLPSSEG